ncbi:MAG: acylphosphatase [Sphingobacteriales bacterium]|nr:acylphosphatase [Sphingobacteriales bacterium]
MFQTISIIVSGKVQGVYYRQYTKEKAIELGVTGEVRNQRDGTVNIVATGSKEQLGALIKYCKKGPPRAMVTGVEVAELDLQQFEHFSIVRF